MSEILLDMAIQFAEEGLDADCFVIQFQGKWKGERDEGGLLNDSPILSECLSSIFCLADQYNPDSDRSEYEFDCHQLKDRVATLLLRLKSCDSER